MLVPCVCDLFVNVFVQRLDQAGEMLVEETLKGYEILEQIK